MLPVPSDPGAAPWSAPEMTFHPPLNVLFGLVGSIRPYVPRLVEVARAAVLPLPMFNCPEPLMGALMMSVRDVSVVLLNELLFPIWLMSRLDGVSTLIAPATVVVLVP